MPGKQQRSGGKKHAATSWQGPERILILALLAYSAVRLLASFLFADGTRTWGIDYAGYLKDQWDIILALALPFVVLIKPANERFAAILQTATKSKGTYWLIGIGFTAIMGFLAWKFQVAFAFLGDGSYYATEIFRIVSDPSYQTALVKPTSFLTGHLLRWIALAMTPENVRIPFQIVGAAGVALLLAGYFWLLRHEKRPVAALMMSVSVLNPALLMFFGYIELYAWTYVFVSLFLLSSFQAFRHGSSVVAPGLLLAIAVALGAATVIFLPAYLLLLHWKVRGTEGALNLKRAAMILCALSCIAVVIVYAWIGIATYNPYLLPIQQAESVVHGLSQGVQSYTVLSGAHILDVINVLLLNAGGLIVLLPVAVSTFRSKIVTEPMHFFGLVSFIGALLLIVFGNTTLGLLRDWDLMTIPVTAISFLAVIVLVYLHEARTLSLAVVLPALILTLGGGTYTWIRVNLSEQASAQRLEDAVEREKASILPLNTHTGLENLRKYYKSVGDESRAIHALRGMVETGHDRWNTASKYIGSIAGLRQTSIQREELRWMYEHFLHLTQNPSVQSEKRMRELTAYAMLSGVQVRAVDLVLEYGERFKVRLSPWKEYELIEAVITPGLSPEKKSDLAQQAVDETTEDASLLGAAARIHAAAMRTELAVSVYEQALAREPSMMPSMYLELARLYYEKLNDIEKTKAALRRCLIHSKGTNEAAEAQRILGQLELRP